MTVNGDISERPSAEKRRGVFYRSALDSAFRRVCCGPYRHRRKQRRSKSKLRTMQPFADGARMAASRSQKPGRPLACFNGMRNLKRTNQRYPSTMAVSRFSRCIFQSSKRYFRLVQSSLLKPPDCLWVDMPDRNRAYPSVSAIPPGWQTSQRPCRAVHHGTKPWQVRCTSIPSPS